MSHDHGGDETTTYGSPSSRITDICDRFEKAWQHGTPPEIEEHLPVEASEPGLRHRVLCSLVPIDLEKRWRTAADQDTSTESTVDSKAGRIPRRPRLSDYIDRYPDLGVLTELPVDLICHEYYCRRRWGDEPSHEEYLGVFAQYHPDLSDALARIDAELDAVQGPAQVEPPGAGYGEERASSKAQPEDENLPDSIGKYVVKGLLGKGAFGRVYRAYDPDLDCLVAIKVPQRDRIAEPEDADNYIREARMVATLDHPRIVPVFYAERTDDGLPFVVSKYIEGGDLRQHSRDRRLSHDESARIVALVAEALHHAHLRDLVHRDIKPENILTSSASRCG